MRLAIALLLLNLAPSAAWSQAPQDFLYARTDINGVPSPPHAVSAFCNQSNGSGSTGMIVVCTLNNTTITAVSNYNQYITTGNLDYQISVTNGPTFIVQVGEPMMVTNSGTAMDVSLNRLSFTLGTDTIASVNTSTAQVTLTSPNSALVPATSSTLTPFRWYEPYDGSGNPIQVTWPWGKGPVIADPLGHAYIVEGTSADCSNLNSLGCQIGNDNVVAVPPPLAPTVAAPSSGGSLGASVEATVEVTYTDSHGETTPSGVTNETTATSGTCPGSGSCEIVVTSPTASVNGDATGYNVYANTCAATPCTALTLQNASPIAIGTNYTWSALVAGAAPPTSNKANGQISRTSNVVTAVLTSTENWTAGITIVVAGCADTSYNGSPFQVQTLNTSTKTVTWNQTGSVSTGTSGCHAQFQGWNKFSPDTNNCKAAQYFISQWQSHGINTLLEDQGDQSLVFTTGTCSAAQVPPILNTLSNNTATIGIDQYASDNLNGHISQPIHEIFSTIDRSFSGLGSQIKPLLDYFDSRYLTFSYSYFGNGGYIRNGDYAGTIGEMMNDTDHNCMACGWNEFPGINGGTNSAEGTGHGQTPAWAATIAAPDQTVAPYNDAYSKSIIYGSNNPFFFPDPTVYTKALSAVQPAGCWEITAGTTPGGNPVGPTYTHCSWPDWVRNWYQTVAAMNTAWGTNYTSFGTTGTQVTGETIATGDGSTITFNYTFANANIQPFSIAITANGEIISGDVPQFSPGGSGSVGTGSFLKPTVFKSNTTVPVGQPYLDSNNNVETVTTAGVTKTGSQTWPGSCSGNPTTTSNTAVFTCEAPAVSSATVTYSSGVLTITFANAPPSGQVIKANYIYGGWHSGGTGVVDEDGDTSGATTHPNGSNPLCQVSPPAIQRSTGYTAWSSIVSDSTSNSWQLATTTGTTASSSVTFSQSVGTTTVDGGETWVSLGYPVCAQSSPAIYIGEPINANQNWAQDMRNWAGWGLSGQYYWILNQFGTYVFPDQINAGSDFGLQSYQIPMDAIQLQVVNFYTDEGFTGEFPYPSTDPATILAPYIYSYVTNYFKKPIIVEHFLFANDWEIPGTGASILANVSDTAIHRAQHLYNLRVNQFAEKSPYGTVQSGGETLWELNAIFQGHGMNFETHLANLPDGNENTMSTVTCSSPETAYSCGQEVSSAAAGIFTNSMSCSHCVYDTWNYWLTFGAAPVLPTAPTRKEIIMSSFPVFF